MTHTRKKGLIAAGTMGIAFALLIGFFMIRGGSDDTTSNQVGTDIDTSLPADLLGTAQPRTGSFSDQGSGLTSAKGLTIQIADKDDPSRRAAEIRSKAVDPQPGGRQAVEGPEAWVYMNDGRILYIRSDHGNFFIPEGDQRPEHGTFRGNAQAKLYKPDEAGNPVNLETDSPALIAWSEGFAFDMTIGQLTTEERVRVTTADLDAAFTGLTVLVDEVNERITLAEINRGEYVRYSPPPKADPVDAEATDEKPEPKPGDNTRPAQPSVASNKQPNNNPNAPRAQSQEIAQPAIESLYHAIFTENVVLDQKGAQIQADQMDVWARLINNELPPNAIGGIDVIKQQSQDTHSRRSRPNFDLPLPLYSRVMSLVLAAQDSQTVLTRRSENDITLRWTGPLVLRPMERTPNELNNDHVALRFTAEQGLVRYADANTGTTGHCSTLAYGATQRKPILSGPGLESVVIDSPEHGTAVASRIEADLSTGIVYIPSQGKFIGPGQENDRDRGGVSWRENANFILAMTEDGAIDGLKEAMFRGSVVIEEGRDTVTGQFVLAKFQKKEDGTPGLSRLIVDGQAVARSDRDEFLESDRLDVTFDPGANHEDPTPTYMIATGNVHGVQNGATINSDRLEASLAQIEETTISDDGQEKTDTNLVVTEAIATGNASFYRRSGDINAAADTIKAWPEQQIVELYGENANVSRAGTSLAGRQIRLDGQTRQGLVFGQGTFAHATGAVDEVNASWTREMRFNDATGLVECFGDVVASGRAIEKDGRIRQDEIAAHQVEIQLSPHEIEDGTDGMQFASSESEDRQVLSMHAVGSILEEENGQNARIESRLYATQPDQAIEEPKLEQLFYIDGPEIIADNQSGTLNIPGAGQLLLGDLRQGSQEVHESGPLVDPKDTARAWFQWDGSLAMDRPAGTMTMRRSVQLRHLTKDNKLSDMECDVLIAHIAELDAEGQNDSQEISAQLESVSAMGAVYFEWGPSGEPATKRLMADRIDYTAAGIAEAFANPGNVVTLFDDDRATAITAAHLYIDTVSDRIEIKDPGPVVSPR